MSIENKPQDTTEQSTPRKSLRYRSAILPAGIVLAGILSFLGASHFPFFGSAVQGSKAARGIVYIDVSSLMQTSMRSMQADPHMMSQAGAIGHIVGSAIQKTADQWSRMGYIVMDGSKVLAAPAASNLTGLVSRDIDTQVRALDAAQVTASAPSGENP